MDLKTAKSNLMITLCILYIVNFYLHADVLTILTVLIIAVIFALGLMTVRKFYGILSLSMAGFSVWMTLRSGGGLFDVAEITMSNFPLLMLIIVVPLLAIPFKEEGYFASVQTLIRSWNTNARRIFVSIAGFLFVFGPILNIGAMRIVHEMIKDLALNARMIARAYFTGMSTAFTWSPFFASVALVLFMLDTPVTGFISIGLPFSVLQLALGYGLFLLGLRVKGETRRRNDGLAADVPPLAPKDRNNLVIMLVLLIAVMASIFVVEIMLGYPIMFVVVMVSIAFPILWGAVRNRWRQLYDQFLAFKSTSMSAMDNEVLMFISAGMFGAALGGTSVSSGLQELLITLASFSFILFCLTVLAVMAAGGLIGIHPLVMVTVFVSQMNPDLLGARPEALALLFMIGWVIMAIVSPITPLNLIVSNSVNRSSFETGIRYNGLYLICLAVMGTVYVTLIR
jgi:hypothetical protein